MRQSSDLSGEEEDILAFVLEGIMVHLELNSKLGILLWKSVVAEI